MMAEPSNSFKQFNYSLRPSKQVERKIMIEVLLQLSQARYNLSEYSYIGFGSPYYVDFVMFHKYLFIEEMTCVEWSDIPKRMRFNKPFKFIKLKLGALSTHIPQMGRTKKYLVWLDYDRSLDLEMLQDIDGCCIRLAPRSIFLITVDARPKLPRGLFDSDELELIERQKLTLKTYQEWFGQYTEKKITLDSISRVHVAPLFYEVIVERIRQTLAMRGNELRFIQLFNYVYQDGAPMLTIGGIVGNEADEQGIQDTSILGHRFVRGSSEHLKISVPPLTVREKYWLDSRLDAKLSSSKLRFELEEELLENYRKFYKEYPTYIEALH